MLVIGLLAHAAAAALPAAPPPQDAPPGETERLNQCMDLATGEPARGVREAMGWRLAGGGFLARQCLGMAYANQQRWPEAADAFADAAREAVAAGDSRAADFWAQAGNAWLAAGDFGQALDALDTAIAGTTAVGLPLGELHLDRARARVAAGDSTGARADLDLALEHAADDPLAWLLSATLARRTGDLDRARRDIAQAVQRSADDASVQLEAGNIAALSGDAGAARAAWNRAIANAPGSAAAASARAALAQFESQ